MADGGNLEVARKPALDHKARECKERLVGRNRCGLGWVGSQVHGKIPETIIADTDERSLSGVVLQVEESRRCARLLASPRFSTPERPWPTPDGFGNAGGKQNNFAEFGVTIFHSFHSFIPHDDVVLTFAPYGTDQPLNIRSIVAEFWVS